MAIFYIRYWRTNHALVIGIWFVRFLILKLYQLFLILKNFCQEFLWGNFFFNLYFFLKKKHRVEPVLYMVEWFMCIFCRTLPWPTVLRVWDMFFCEGYYMRVLTSLYLMNVLDNLRSKWKLLLYKWVINWYFEVAKISWI